MNPFTKVNSFTKVNFFHLNSEDCKNKLQRLKITTKKGTNRKIIKLKVFPGSAHQVELKRHQGHIELDDTNPYHRVHGRSTYDLHDKNWIPHIRIYNPLNFKTDTKKDKGYKERRFFDWKIQFIKKAINK